MSATHSRVENQRVDGCMEDQTDESRWVQQKQAEAGLDDEVKSRVQHTRELRIRE